MQNKEINFKKVKNFLSLYVHLPFCAKKCFYCSFVVFIKQQNRMSEYVDCIVQEMMPFKEKKLYSIYIGGGTPTFLDDDCIEKLFTAIKNNFFIPDDAEVTIEANPESLTFEKIKLLKRIGVNRLSIGIQSLNNKYLKFLGRAHERNAAIEAYRIARENGFTNINLDLMYGFPDQTDKELKKDVLEIIDLNSEHISLYSLNLEKNSLFHAKKIDLPSKEKQAEQYLMVLDLIKKSCFNQYEVSNFSKSKRESTHNINYWTGGNYIGLGAGAHSHKDGKRCWNSSRLSDYINNVKSGESIIEGSEFLNKEKRLIESLLFGLRMVHGFCLEQLEKRYGCKIDKKRMEMINNLTKEGLLVKNDNRLCASRKGILVLDEISAYLI